jgi:hypothetical protein
LFPYYASLVEYQTGRIRHYNYDVKLSKLQKRALRFTWHRLQTRNGGKRVENVFEEVICSVTASLSPRVSSFYEASNV